MGKKDNTMVGKFQGGNNFGFFIPQDRAFYGGDFYVSKKDFGLAEDGDKVEAVEVDNVSGKKLEAKIVKVFGKIPQKKPVFIEGVYSSGDGNFGFIDVQGQEKGVFVYGRKKGFAKDGDKVKAEVVDFNGKKEAIVVKVFQTEEELVVGEFRDSDRFGFVIPEKIVGNDGAGIGDVFIAGGRKNGAKNGDIVEVQIIKRRGKNPEGVIKRVMV